MREIFTHQDYTRVGYYKSILDDAGIHNFIRNEHVHNTMTQIVNKVYLPTLCVAVDEDYDRAMQILSAMHNPPPCETPDWCCPKCAESVPGNFDLCWKCGEPRNPLASGQDAPKEF
jgi:hypothetical protein